MTTWTTTDAGPAYLSARRGRTTTGVQLIGAPYDSTTSYRPGARFGPDSLRVASDVLETYSPVLDRDLENVALFDAGNLVIPFGAPEPVVNIVYAATHELLTAGARVLLLGGEHTVSVGAVRAYAERFPDLCVVQLDAHADLRPDYLGDAYNHACAMRRVLEVVSPGALWQVGIRSGTREEFVEMREQGRLLEPRADALQRALDPYRGRPFYVTVDLDVFDPSVLPGTGTPEPGGIDWRTFETLLAVLDGHWLVGGDVVELAPPLDPSGRSPVAAAKVVRELALCLGPLTLS